MQSNYARYHATYLDDSFRKDLKSFLSLSDGAREQVAKLASERLIKITSSDHEDILE